jgi:hypothetical protein
MKQVKMNSIQMKNQIPYAMVSMEKQDEA